uniref:Uncharacterized protein n=1 Tax=Ditylenchus dipsaci TaxID=166011 RepID=A0A915DAU0_9BILA
MYKTLTFLLLSAIADVEFIGTADSDLFSCYYGEGEDPVLSSVQECHPETNRWCLKIISEDPSLQLERSQTKRFALADGSERRILKPRADNCPALIASSVISGTGAEFFQVSAVNQCWCENTEHRKITSVRQNAHCTAPVQQCDTGDICPEFGNRCAKADFNLSSIKMSFDAYTVCCCDSLKCNMTNPNVSKPSIIAFLLIMIVLICCILSAASMLPRSDVPFQVSEFTFPAIIPPVISRAASHSSQPIKGSTSISNSQEPHALSSSFNSFEPADIDMALNSFVDDSDFPELDPVLGNSSRVSSSSSSSYAPSSNGYYTIAPADSDVLLSRMLASIPAYQSHDRYESVSSSSYTSFQGSIQLAAGRINALCHNRRLVPIWFRPPPPVTSMPYAVKRDDEVEASQPGPKGSLQLNQSPVLKVQHSSQRQCNISSQQISPSPSVCTENAASITPRPKCSGIDSPPHVVDNTFSLTPFTGSTIGTYGEDREDIPACTEVHVCEPVLNYPDQSISIGNSIQINSAMLTATEIQPEIIIGPGTDCPISSSLYPVYDACVDPVRVTPVNSVFQVDANKRTVPYSSSSINSYQPGALCSKLSYPGASCSNYPVLI